MLLARGVPRWFEEVLGSEVVFWYVAHVHVYSPFFVGLKRTWDQKLSSGWMLSGQLISLVLMSLTLMTTYLSQFRFADTGQYRLITLTFLRTWIIVVEVEGFFKGEDHRY